MTRIKTALAGVSAWLNRSGWVAIIGFCLGFTLMIAVEATLEAIGWL